MAEVQKQSWTLSELAETSGIPARTIRFYIARGLLSGPEVAGRGATYGPAHLERLGKIRELQAGGLMLAEISRLLSGGEPVGVLPQAHVWEQYAISGDVVVSVRGDLSPWRRRQVRRALVHFAQQVKKEDDDERGN